jgi:hypothetical protein
MCALVYQNSLKIKAGKINPTTANFTEDLYTKSEECTACYINYNQSSLKLLYLLINPSKRLYF